MKADVTLFLKGLAMGAANVIPGVSGGTIALITGIYERLIDAIRHVDVTTARLVLGGDIAGAWRRVDGRWLAIVLGGVAVSIVTLARLFEFLLEGYERWTMAFFFGLILLSVLYVARGVSRWSASTLASLAVGTAIAIGIALLAPASENPNALYVFVCGIVAISSMILPGLSGSFVLIIMGNYALVLGAISSFSLGILVPLGLGCAFGLVAFSHVLAWVFKRVPDQTLALMTGFVLGSLVVIWPWKETILATIERGAGEAPKEVVTGYRWFLPDWNAPDTLIALALMLAGIAAIWLMERVAGQGADGGGTNGAGEDGGEAGGSTA